MARIPRLPAAMLTALWMALLWHLSSGPPPETPLGLPWSLVFNLAHAPLFGVLGLLVTLALPRAAAERAWPVLGPRQVAVVLFVAAGYALVDEWRQSSVPGRTASIRDLFTDLTAVACTLWIVVYLARASATESGVRGRFAAGVILCLAAAGVATA